MRFLMDLSLCEQFSLRDSSSFDNSGVESMLEHHRQQMVVAVQAVKEVEDRNRNRHRGSTVSRLCIRRNCHLGNMMSIQDYLAYSPTYLPHLFRRRYRMRPSLFVKIVQACEANCRFFTGRRNAAGLLGFSAYQKISAAMWVIPYVGKLGNVT